MGRVGPARPARRVLGDGYAGHLPQALTAAPLCAESYPRARVEMSQSAAPDEGPTFEHLWNSL